MGVYTGGIPDQGGKNLYPSTSGDDSKFKPDNGPQNATYTKGGPATFDESKGGSQILDDKGYEPAGEIRPGGMQTRDLNDISHDA